MEEELKALLNSYREDLADAKGFNPCTDCCDLASDQATEYVLERIIEDLERIIG